MDEEYEKQVARVEAMNEKMLDHFTSFLILEEGVGKNKAHDYAEALRFFGNDYLLQYGDDNLLEGLASFPAFVGSWFIRKAMWSDAEAVRMNVKGFELFILSLKERGKITEAKQVRLNQTIEENLERWCSRADRYNDPEMDLNDLFDEMGQWKDEVVPAIAMIEKAVRMPGSGKLALNLLLSAKVAKFCGIKPPNLLKLEGKKDWEESDYPWFANWRCEEAFGMKGTKEKVILVTNERTRYSVLIRIPGKDAKRFLIEVHTAIMRAFDRFSVPRPVKVELAVRTLSGTARSLSAYQNQVMYYLDHAVDRGDFEYLDDLEKPINRLPTSVDGICLFPADSFSEMSEKEPPFDSDPGLDVIVPFFN